MKYVYMTLFTIIQFGLGCFFGYKFAYIHIDIEEKEKQESQYITKLKTINKINILESDLEYCNGEIELRSSIIKIITGKIEECHEKLDILSSDNDIDEMLGKCVDMVGEITNEEI